jgi:hypothetical protein
MEKDVGESVVTQIPVSETEESRKKQIYPGRDTKLRPPWYEAEVLNF